MKLVVLADLHGNFHALEAILADLGNEAPDQIVCAGDVIGCNPYPGSIQAWETLKGLRIPMVLGNQEDFVIRYHSSVSDPLVQKSVRFMPIQHLARQFTAAQVEELKALPMTLTIQGPHGDNVLVCHASPNTLNRSFTQDIGGTLSALTQTRICVIVGGHLHTSWWQELEGKLLLLAGSAGLPLKHKLGEVEYLILTHTKTRWQFRHKTVAYDHRLALDAALASDFLAKSGPIGWLLFDEILIQQDHLSPFLRDHCPRSEPNDVEDWEELVRGYLKYQNRWDVLNAYLHH